MLVGGAGKLSSVGENVRTAAIRIDPTLMQDYTPGKIMRYLGSFRFLRMQLETPERMGNKRHVPALFQSGLENQLETLADLERVIYDLPEPDFIITAAIYVLDIPLDVIAARLGMDQRDVGPRAMAGVRQIAESLGWPGYQEWAQIELEKSPFTT